MTAEKDEAMAAVLLYLRKMGYRQTERLFREEAHITGMESLAFELSTEQDSNIANYILFSNQPFDLAGYAEAYDNLCRWIYDSLDAFKEELLPILFPLFVHCFLDLVSKNAINEARSFMERFKSELIDEHEDELVRLSAVSDPSQVKENPLASTFRSNKYNLVMSAYSFQLLMNYLQDGGALANVVLLKIINQFINIRVIVNKPSTAGSPLKQSLSIAGLTGASAELSSSMNKGKVYWGVSPMDSSIEGALQQRSKVETRLNEILQGPLAHLKRIYTQSSLNSPPASEQAPKPPPTVVEINAEIDRLRNMAKRVNLSSLSLPSICFYTLHNSFEGVTSIDFSPFSHMMATGNRDSYIDLWSLNHEQLRAIRPSTELAAMDLTDFDSLEPMREFDGSLSKRLIGHSGPVYSCKFLPPDGQRFMVSVSYDGTARLWSLDLFSCVVVYRGHNSPIWDIDVAPLGVGPYFATASADRTARLWSTEHVQPLRIFAGHLSDVDCVRFHPNGNYVLTGSADKTVRMWDIQTGSCVRLFAGHARGISSLCITPDGRHLASVDKSGLLKMWDLAEGRLLRSLQIKRTMKGASMSQYTMEFDRDGRILAIGGADMTVRLFDFAKFINMSITDESLLLLASYPTKQTPIFKVHFTYRNVLLASGPFKASNVDE